MNEITRYYGITQESFEKLFGDNSNMNTDIVASLGKSAADGNLNCVDMLLNISLRQDDIGRFAESILFNLFSGKTGGKIGVDKEIQQTCLRFYEKLTAAKNPSIETKNKLSHPSRLLYIVGSAITDRTKQYDLSTIFSKNVVRQSKFESFDNDNIWNNNRLLSTDEITFAMKGLISNPEVSLNFPINLIDPNAIDPEAEESNVLTSIIKEKKRISQDKLLDKPEIYPVNIGEHWVLFLTYTNNTSKQKECVVFNTLNELPEISKKYFMASALCAGVTPTNIKFVNGNIQENIPNGCGIFVIKAAELLSKETKKEPAVVLNEFVESITKESIEAQVKFNIHNRRQIYEYSIE